MSSSIAPETAHPWRRNLVVCCLGSFTTIIGMTLILPILPLHVRNLGVTDPAAVTAWSGVAYAATFLTAALTAPLWGHLGDRYGRKAMLIRASLGMAIAMPLIGLAQDVYQLVGLRLLAGLLGGYASGSHILVAAQTPKNKSAWAMGVLSSAIMAGSLVGPLLGGLFAQTVGIREVFFLIGGVIFMAFLGTALFLREEPTARLARRKKEGQSRGGWAQVPHKPPVVALLALSALLTFASISVEPIITEHVLTLTGTTENVAVLSAVVFSLTALGAMLSGPWLGRVADKRGNLSVVAVSLATATVLLVLQFFAPDLWWFAVLRFATGVALGGITPAVDATLRWLLPGSLVGLVFGYSLTAQYLAQVSGPVLAGLLGGVAGTAAVFLAMAAVTGLGLLAVLAIRPRVQSHASVG